MVFWPSCLFKASHMSKIFIHDISWLKLSDSSVQNFSKVDKHTECFPLGWNMTVKYRKLLWARSTAICKLYAVINSVLICTSAMGSGVRMQIWQTRGENIHFTLKIMHIIGQNKSSWDHVISGKSAPNCR